MLALDEYSQLDVVDTQLFGVRYDEVPEKLKVDLEAYQCPRVRVKGGRKQLKSSTRKKLRRASIKVTAVEALSIRGSERRKNASPEGSRKNASNAAAAVAADAEAPVSPAVRRESTPPKRKITYSEV